jgi:hypothetical protein
MIELGGLLGLMEKYGVSLVLLILIGIGFWKLVKYLMNRMDKQEEYIKNQNDVLKTYIEKNTKSEITEKTLTSYAEKAVAIYEISHRFLNDIDANRIAIYEYHNGGHNMCGIDFKKCSLHYETTDQKTQKIAILEQAMPLSINPLWNKLIIEDKPIYISSISNLECGDNSVYLTLKNQNIKSYYLKQLRTIDNKLLGFMTITYYNDEKILSDDELKRFSDITIYVANKLDS